MTRPSASDRLVGLAYEAALEPDGWPVLLDELRQSVDADSALLRVYGAGCNTLDLNLTIGFDPAYQQLYHERFVRDDPVRDRVAALPPGEMRRGDDIIPFQSLRHTAFYNDYMRPQGKRHLLGGPLLCQPDLVAILGAQCRRHLGPFSRARRSWLTWLAGHLQRALDLALRADRMERPCSVLSALLDAVPPAVFGLDKAGHVLFTNAAGDRLLADGADLHLRDGTLHARDVARERQLRQQIAAVVRPSEAGNGPRTSMLGTCSAGGGPMGLLAIPWTDAIHNDLGCGRELRALVLVESGQRGGAGPADLVADLLRLTRAEARLTVALVECGTLQAAAERCGIRVSTARGYIKSALHKTGCRREAELVRTVLRTPLAHFSGLGRSH